MGKLIVELPDELHARLKGQAMSNHQTLKVIVTSLLQHYLSPVSYTHLTLPTILRV